MKHFERLELLERFERFGVTPRVWTDFGGEFRMPSGRKKGVVDERAEKVFSGIQAASHWGVAQRSL
jgi:hypothetical protein